MVVDNAEIPKAIEEWWQNPATHKTLDEFHDDDRGLWDKIIGNNWLFSLLGHAGEFLWKAVANIFNWTIAATVTTFVGIPKQLGSMIDMNSFMLDMSWGLRDAVYTSRYDWSEGSTDIPFSREFGEPVTEIREVFSKFHKVDSLRNIIGNNITVSANEMYPVVTSVSRGKKPKTVYADKSISPEFQRELVYENNLNFDMLNFRDGIHAKRIGLAAMARSLRTMYQGTIDILGDPLYEPWDMLFIADVVTDMWGTCQVREVTHVMDGQM